MHRFFINIYNMAFALDRLSGSTVVSFFILALLVKTLLPTIMKEIH